MITKKDILDVYVFIKTKNHDIPDEVLDFIKDAAYVGIAALLSFGGSALAPYYRLKMLRKETENLKKQIKVLEEVKSLKEAVQELKNKTQSLEE
jgi:hypothetical protein